ncbi:MAG TPA: 3'-5' exonuclease, partial [archaeon]|nr:3'-5' exonuclease [archaeon]
MSAAKVRFCLLDCEHAVEEGKPVVRLWGRTDTGKTVCVLDAGFRPSLYVEPKKNAGDLAAELRAAAVAEELPDGRVVERKPERAEVVRRTFLGTEKQVVQVTLTVPADVPKFRELVKSWGSVAECYEYAVPFAKRYLIDRGLVPLEWVEAEGEPVQGSGLRADIVLAASAVKPVKAAAEAAPRFRVLAFDIELIERPAEQVIMVSLADSEGYRRVLAVGGAAAAAPPDVELVESERALLERFLALVQERDPDIVAGYNSDRFDFAKVG